MKQLLAIGLYLVLFLPVGNAQVVGGTFDKLLDFYVLERFEDCLYKAQKLSQNDKFRREPEPYLYMSMCFFEIHMNIEEYDELLYKNALKDAQKYAYKFRKKDKDKTYFDNNGDYFETLKRESLDQARFFFKDSDYRKAAGVYGRIVKFEPEDNGVLFISGVSNIMAKNVGPGNLQLKEAVTKYREDLKEGNVEIDPNTKDDLIITFVKYSDFLKESNQLDSAQVTIDLAKELIRDNLILVNQSKKLEKG